VVRLKKPFLVLLDINEFKTEVNFIKTTIIIATETVSAKINAQGSFKKIKRRPTTEAIPEIAAK
jgi:hypothetical protein